MTRDQHRQIGRLLGFPECCTEAWMQAFGRDQPLAASTGHIEGRTRSKAEQTRLNRAVSALLGRPWRGCDSLNPRVLFVPCATDCPEALALGRHFGPQADTDA